LLEQKRPAVQQLPSQGQECEGKAVADIPADWFRWGETTFLNCCL
jgi:hypothetical protein